MTIRDDSTNVSVDYTLVPRVAGVGNIYIKMIPMLYMVLNMRI